jgi:hypothetical protein
MSCCCCALRFMVSQALLPALVGSPDPRVVTILSGGVHSAYQGIASGCNLKVGMRGVLWLRVGGAGPCVSHAPLFLPWICPPDYLVDPDLSKAYSLPKAANAAGTYNDSEWLLDHRTVLLTPWAGRAVLEPVVVVQAVPLCVRVCFSRTSGVQLPWMPWQTPTLACPLLTWHPDSVRAWGRSLCAQSCLLSRG